MNHVNPKEKNIVFNLIHFNLEIWIQFNWIETQLNLIWIQFNFLIQIQLRCIELKLHCENLFNIKSFKWTLIFTKSTHPFHLFIFNGSVQ
jgi:hypothetical protein